MKKIKNIETAQTDAKTAANTDKKVVDAKPQKTETEETIRPLTNEEKAALEKCDEAIKDSKQDGAANFLALIGAIHTIVQQKLYLGTHTSAAAFAKERYGFGRAHWYRYAKEGKIIERVSPLGDGADLLVSESHLRPLLSLTEAQQDEVISLVAGWTEMADQDECSPKLVQSAVGFVKPPAEPSKPNAAKTELVAKFTEIIQAAKENLPEKPPKEILKLFGQMEKKATALGDPPRKSGIDWTTATWNPLQGCARKSAGCDNCYAAKLVATRLRDVYPGLAKEVKKNGKKQFIFTNKILLLPDQFGIPLLDKVPKRYFVNSMSDLFHDKVPEDFIRTVFQIMEKAHWHQFQVLTKRPERMAAFTKKYYGDRDPAPNIWLGASTEDQEAFDGRIDDLKDTKAAILWLSCEPLIGPITKMDLTGIDWIVVGGESGSDRKMEKAWAMSIRDQCEKAKVPFFFKQWGDFNEEGVKQKRKVKKDGGTPVPLDGEIHNAYPASLAQANIVEPDEVEEDPVDKKKVTDKKSTPKRKPKATTPVKVVDQIVEN